MKEILRTNDPMRLSLIQQLLEDNGLYCALFDNHSGMMMSGIGGVAPRLMVLDDDFDEAVELVKEMEKSGF